MVGREGAVRNLRSRITSSALHPTIEGDNGVGKTSLVAVAGYQLRTEFEAGTSSQALIPLPEPFQLTASDSVAAFTAEVYYKIAQAFIEHADLLKSRGIKAPETGDVNRWLNAPIFRSGGVNASVFGNGGGANYGSEPNTSSGYTEAGFVATVETWLREAFPDLQAGAFICVIDNLELLETSKAARALLESMRDGILNRPGLRWVLCGARGIMRTTAASPRLDGRLGEPMDLEALPDVDVAEVITRRVEVYAVNDEAVAPVDPRGFTYLYELLNRNLRNTLKYCEAFTFWLHENEPNESDPESIFGLLETWMTTQAEAAHENTVLTATAWEVFDGIVGRRGTISPSDFSSFGFKKMANLRPYIKALEEAQLVVSTNDESDKRRRTILMTPRGWLVNYARSGYKLPER